MVQRPRAHPNKEFHKEVLSEQCKNRWGTGSELAPHITPYQGKFPYTAYYPYSIILVLILLSTADHTKDLILEGALDFSRSSSRENVNYITMKQLKIAQKSKGSQ